MLTFNDKLKQYEIVPIKVHYKKRGKVKEKFATPNKKWWEDTIALHDHLELIKFEDVEITKEMKKRYNYIKKPKKTPLGLYRELSIAYIQGEELPDKVIEHLKGNIKLSEDEMIELLDIKEGE